MIHPVDLTDLHGMTDGDSVMERELFSEFLASSEACIEALIFSSDKAEAELWRVTAHALKGSALSLGASTLGALCNHAQEAHMASSGEKQAILAVILAEYHNVKVYLRSLCQ